jgi:putative acetyltransferase
VSELSTSLLLRPPTDAERPALVDLWVASWRATYPDIDFDARRPWLEQRLAKLEMDGAHTICAFDGAAMLGFVSIDARTNWLDQIAVHPQAIGAGVGAALLDEAKRVSPARVELDVNADNFRARKFYEREGFALIGVGVNALSGRKTVTLEWRPTPHAVGDARNKVETHE